MFHAKQLHRFPFSASSNSRLMASGRFGKSSCFLRQSSSLVRLSACNRSPIRVPTPVDGGRPLDFVLSLIDVFILSCYHKGKPKEISFNLKYLSDGLKAVESKDVFWGLNEDNRPALLRSTTDASYFYANRVRFFHGGASPARAGVSEFRRSH